MGANLTGCTSSPAPSKESSSNNNVEKLQKKIVQQKTLTNLAMKELQQVRTSLINMQNKMATTVGSNLKNGIFSSQLPDVYLIPAEKMSLTEFVFENLADFSDRIAVVDPETERSYDYAKLHRLIKRVGAGLHKRGFHKGDVFALYAPNIREFPIVFHAVASIGGIITSVNPQYKLTELVYQLRDTQAKFLATTADNLKIALKAVEECGHIKEVFVFGSEPFAVHKDRTVEVSPFRELKGETLPEVVICPKTDVVVISYSSGTSGLPKGVMLTHYNIISNLIQSQDSVNLNYEDVLLGVLPMFHIYGMFIFLCGALRQGAQIVTMKRKFNLPTMLSAMQKYKVTVAYLVPPIILDFANDPIIDKYDLSNLREIISGAAPLSQDLAEMCVDRIGCGLRQGYGMTELSPIATISSIDTTKYDSIGRLVANTEVKVINLKTREPCRENECGELWIRGPQVMKGYLNNQEATEEVLVEDGFLKTGDIGMCDSEGDFFIVDRVKELIKYKSFQVHPAELEAILLENAEIVDAAVIGIPNEKVGEIPRAYIVRNKYSTITAQEIIDYVAKKVSSAFKKIRQVKFVDLIPKSPSGKILKLELKELALKSSDDTQVNESKEEDHTTLNNNESTTPADADVSHNVEAVAESTAGASSVVSRDGEDFTNSDQSDKSDQAGGD